MRKCTRAIIMWSILINTHNVVDGSQPAYETFQDNFYVYTTENGLVHNSVKCIAQDKEGFLWIGSNGGLERFDGYDFSIYKPGTKNTNNLNATSVWSVYIDYAGDLWVGTIGGGLSKYNRDLDNFRTYRHDKNNKNSISSDNISCIFEDLMGNFWVATKGGGLNLFKKSSESFTRFLHQPGNDASISDNQIHDYCIDGSGNIWLGTESGICILDPITKVFRNYFDTPGDLAEINDAPCLSLFYKETGEVWIGTWLHGLYRFDLISHKKENYRYSKNKVNSLAGNIIWDINKDSFDRIWIGTTQGLNRYDGKNNGFIRYVSDPTNPTSISENFIWTIFEDQKGVLWIGTNNGGLNKLDLYRKKFEHYYYVKDYPNSLSCGSVNAICDDYAGRIWIGTCNGLNLFDRRSGSFSCFLSDPDNSFGVVTDDINALVKGKPPYLWIGNDVGFSRFDTKTHDFVNYRHDRNNLNSLSNDAVFSLYYDKQGVLWIGSWGGGLDKFEPEKNMFTNYPLDSINPSRNVILCITEDDQQNLYLGTYSHGLVKFNKTTHQKTYYESDINDPEKLKGNVVLYLHHRNENELWVCTDGEGLSLFDTKKETFKTFDVENGLPSSDIMGILQDDDNNLWISTSKGLSKLVFVEGQTRHKFINFDTKDGLQANVFNQRACFKSQDGEMYFGGINGLNVFRYDSIRPNPFNTNVVITSIEILNKPVKIGKKINGRVILSKSIAKTDKIILTYKEYVISFEFAALHFSAPLKNQYLYKLDGFEKDWIKTGADRRFASYSNLNPGKYNFRVKASNNDGKWSDYEAQLKIIVLPPWWKTWWFRILIVLIIAGIFGYFYLSRMQRLKTMEIYLRKKIFERTNELQLANNELQERQDKITTQNEELARHRNHLEKLIEERTKDLERALKKTEESDKLKSSFLANMSHEIRTPMNAIVGFSALLKEYNLSEEERNHYIDIINKNCQSLLVLINDILDISKIEANQISILKSPFHVDKIMKELEQFFKMKVTKDVKVKYIKLSGEVVIENDAVRFRQILTNLLSNAIKYTEAGHIHFGYEKKDNHLRFYVSDTGIGVHKSEFENIFNRFTKGEFGRTKLYRGAGLGLSISKNLIQKMGGKIWVESEPDKGSTFYFTLPYNPQLLKSLHKKETKKTVFAFDLSNVHILIVENEPSSYLYLARVLKPTNASVHIAINGLEAVDLIRNAESFKFSLVLMDIKMPVMNGIDAFIEIQKIDKKIPIVAQTAFAQDIDKQQAIKIGFADYLIKPIRQKDLLEVIQKYLIDHINSQ